MQMMRSQIPTKSAAVCLSSVTGLRDFERFGQQIIFQK